MAIYYHIEYHRYKEKTLEVGKIDWRIKDFTDMERNIGVYFLRTNVHTFDEKITWGYYNLIREIETTCNA